MTGLSSFSESRIISALIKLKSSGLNNNSIKSISDKPMHLSRYSNLDDPESIKSFISEKKDINYRITLVKAYDYFCQINGIKWSKPGYNPHKGLPRPPTTEQVKQLIAGSSKKYSIIFKLMSETRISPMETSILKETSFDYDRKILYVTGRKGHLDRTIPISEEMIALAKIFCQVSILSKEPDDLSKVQEI